MPRRTEREITATLLRKIADNIDLLNESQAKALRTDINAKFRTFSAMNGKSHEAAEAVKEIRPGPKVSQSKNLIDYLTPTAPQEITFILGGMIERVKERNYKFLPRLTLGLKELGYIPENIKKVDIYRALIKLGPGQTQQENEKILGDKKEFCRKLKDLEDLKILKIDPEKYNNYRKFNAQIITEALHK